MDKDELLYWKKAGKTANEALHFGKSLIKADAKVIDIANKIEDFIIKKNCKIGFPVQISLNNIAAHYTPFPDDVLEIKSGDIVKLDLGAHFDGYIGDNALTVEVDSNNNSDLIKASLNGLNAAIKMARPGVKLCEIGAAISSEVESFGFKPIRNLFGHCVKRYELHAGFVIPNYNNKDKNELMEDMVIAIEPHVTDGVGMIKNGKASSNWLWPSIKKVPRDLITRKVLDNIKTNIGSLPFATRHLTKNFPLNRLNYALNILEKEKIIFPYEQLIEVGNGLVSQHEHTILVKDKPIILTDKDS